jgi:hypothetical protein
MVRDPTDRRRPFRSTGTVQVDVSIMPRYDVRASDLDRERVVEFLKAHYTDGRLQPDELAWRTDAAYRAVGLSELDRLTADLPAYVAPRRRRRFPLATAVVLCAALVALLVVVPAEAWLVALLVAAVMGLVAFVLVAPIAVPLLLLAFVVHVIVRAARPRPHRVGWR